MKINSAEFVISSPDLKRCPKPAGPEYAFIGRSNVGKSSLINMLVDRKKLAKTSGTPGKTQLINHFIINKQWFLVDLPGYGFAKVSKTTREKWGKIIRRFLNGRENLVCTFILIDIRIEPQASDLELMGWLGESGLPFVIVFTKMDKLSKTVVDKNLEKYKQTLLQSWEELPPVFLSSAKSQNGKDEILKFINEQNKMYNEYMSGR